MSKKKEKYMFLDVIVRWCYALQEIFERYPKESTIPSFKRKLRKRGYKVFKYVNATYFCQLHPNKTKDLVLEYYHRTMDVREKSFYLDCLYDLENSDLFYFLREEYEKYNALYIQYQYLEDLIGQCIYQTKDIKWKEEYVTVVDEFILSIEIWPFLLICGDFNIGEAIPIIKNWVNNDTYFLHDITLEALKKYKNKNLLLLKIKEKIYDFYPFEITDQMLEDGKIEFMEEKQESTIPEFIEKVEIVLEKDKINVINAITLCQENPIETQKLILDFYQKSKLISDKCYYIKCLTTSKNVDLFPFLLEELRKYRSKKCDFNVICTSLNCAFYYTRNIKYKEEYVQILEDDKYMNWSYMIIKLCGKLQIQEAVPYLLKVLETGKHPETYRALDTLSHYVNLEQYTEVFKKFTLFKSPDVRNLAKKILKSIDKKTK